jgi:hypothetical protein
MTKQLTAIIEREGDGYVSLCPEFESASTEEIKQRMHEEVYVTRVEVAVG